MRFQWDNIKKDYVEGVQEKGILKYPSLRELCGIHKCSFSTIQKKCAADQWKMARKSFQAKLDEKRVEKKTEAISTESAKFDTQCLQVANAGLALVMKTMAHFGKKGTPTRPDSLKKVMETAKTIQGLGRLALGQETEISKSKIEGEIKRSSLLVVPGMCDSGKEFEELAKDYYKDFDPEDFGDEDDDKE